MAADAVDGLPWPDPAGRDHSRHLQQHIIQQIEHAGGALTFAEYMRLALYEPGLGYYMAGALKFGADGDFVTAPEVSPLFGAALSHQAVEILNHTGGDILEFGAGSGKLAASIVAEINDQCDFNYLILEPSAELKARQQQYLKGQLPDALYRRVRWCEELPSAFYGVMIANEVMDALPVERFQVQSQIQQYHVIRGDQDANAQSSQSSLPGAIRVAPSHSESKLSDVAQQHRALAARLQPASNEVHEAVRALEEDMGEVFPAGYESELCLLLKPWIKSLEQAMHHGVMLLIDYGYPRAEYYSRERSDGTLTCYYQHRAHTDPFHWPGLQDITAHVDFTAVAESAVASSLDLLGYATQSAFLLDNHLLDLAEQQRLRLRSEVERLNLSKAIKTLTLPGEMGERFQVMALGKRYDAPLTGFRSQDLTHRL